jgi:hypothetical protein
VNAILFYGLHHKVRATLVRIGDLTASAQRPVLANALLVFIQTHIIIVGEWSV